MGRDFKVYLSMHLFDFQKEKIMGVKLSPFYSRIKIVAKKEKTPLSPYYSRIRVAAEKKKTQLTSYYSRIRVAAEKGEAPPDLGQVSEMIRSALTKEYGTFPPNLSTTISPEGLITITAVNPESGLNVQIAMKNLAGNLITPAGTTTGVVPPTSGTVPSGM